MWPEFKIALNGRLFQTNFLMERITLYLIDNEIIALIMLLFALNIQFSDESMHKQADSNLLLLSHLPKIVTVFKKYMLNLTCSTLK